MKRTLGLLVPALLVLVAVSSHAAVITNTYYVTASGFTGNFSQPCTSVPAPVDPLKLAFSISFDNSVDIDTSTANITLISLNTPNSGSLLYIYIPTDNDRLNVGDNPVGANVITGPDQFTFELHHISTSP